MTIKLASLKANLERETDGDWVEYPDWPGVAFKVSSLHAPAYETARDLLISRLARIHKQKPIPRDERAEEFGKLYAKHILHGWRGLDVEYTPERAVEVLCDPAYREVVSALEWCAAKIAELQVEFTEVAAKNFDGPSAGKSPAKVRMNG